MQTKLTRAREKVLLQTTDHWNIAAYHYTPEEVKYKYPVFMLHGISSDHHIWDLGEKDTEHSFAYFMAKQGFHVVSLDLRGRGGSDGPHTGRGKNWSVDDYLLCDLPRAIEYIKEVTGQEKVHWVGHSLGGILGYFYQIRHKTDNLASLTTFASALTYSYSTINHFRSFMDYMAVLEYFPIDMWWKSLLPTIDLDFWWNRFLWIPDNLTAEAKRQLVANAVHRIGVFEWNQIKTISSAEGMPRITGDNHHYVTDRRIRTPVLILAADEDWLCPLDGVEWTSKNLRVENKLMVFGKDYGNKTNYGHIDLVCGINAPTEVWPEALRWIKQRDTEI